MSVQPGIDDLNQARIEARAMEWLRAGRETYKREAMGNEPVKPSDIIRTAEKDTP